ncbi:AAA family ATPase [Gordoniibacillus kamchatkensis]|uniref:AAA family ATPase n=1 Tax=Gordoniibacillus kamchatkensis TaxID=1590651 RepID=UPI0006979B44|nr:AAA family ATPase [Paenibacillus sp. VKM B-2647]
MNNQADWKPEHYGIDPVAFQDELAAEGIVGGPSRKLGKSVRDLMQQKFLPLKWAVEGIIPEGLTVIAGKPKLGKSWMMLGIAFDVAAGKPTMGDRRTEQGEVLYLALEDGDRRIQDRVSKIMKGIDVPEGFYYETLCPRLDCGGRESIEEWIENSPKPRMIIVDTLAMVKPIGKSNTNAYASDYAAINHLKRLADKHGISIVVVTHTRKSAADDVFDTVTGTTGITGAADTNLVLDRPRAKVDAILSITGRDVEEQELAMSFDKESWRWSIVGNMDQIAMPQSEQEIIRAMRSAGEPMKPAQVAALINKDRKATGTYMQRMTEKGHLRGLGNGFYEVAV